MRRLYDWTLSLAERPNALWALAAVAFIESSIFPIPPDVMLVPMILAARERAWTFAAVCTAASVLGGYAGYLIGWGAFETVGRPVLEFYGAMEKFGAFQAWFDEWGPWAVFGAGVTPFPYKVITITSGAMALDPWTFGVASVAARGLRFFIVAALLYWLGPPIRKFIERNFGLVATAFFIILIGGFVAARYLFH